LSVVSPDGSLTDPYQNFIALSKYARWRDDLGRRETWAESVHRYVSFMKDYLVDTYNYPADDPIFEEVEEAILNLEVMPSMRALMTAGPALARNHMAAYNCSFYTISDPIAFSEGMLISLQGTGDGFSVRRVHKDKLPVVPEEFVPGPIIVVEDSKEGWAESFREVIDCLYAGKIPTWDLSNIRPKGARLKTFGGRASGPGPLDQLFRFTVDVFKGARGRRLSSLEVHDIMCKVGDIVVSGGVRRSAKISLSDLNDFEMAKAKAGNWWENNGQRALANNSAVYTERPPVAQFLREWRNLIESQSGERGIFNLAGARAAADKIGRDGSKIEGTNPCAEIVLRDMGVCNLTEVVIRSDDTLADLKRKIRIASILGTWQSTLTDFKGLRPEWKQNAEEERLLGVSLTGIYGNKIMNNPNDVRLPHRLTELRKLAQKTNQKEADKIGINPSVAVTTVKPSGTVSQLTGVSSGIHPWYAEHYIRTVRGNVTDAMTKLMMDAGVPNEPDVRDPENTVVFSFPISAPKGAVTREDISALDHLALWMVYKEYWADHSVSITVNVKDDEWIDVAGWVYRNFDKITGISFLPYSDHIYQQAPYQQLEEVDYRQATADFPKSIRWADLVFYETEDGTTGSQTLACSADSCEVVDLV
jgi:ribonucleoside-triphosphate reductase (thioredoxin)